MKRAIALVIIASFATAAAAEQALQEFSWSQLDREGRLKNGKIVPAGKAGPFESLMVENLRGEAASITILAVQRPKIAASAYAIRGQVSYQDVEGSAYLEMWNHFPGGERYFSRTLGRGLMKSLEGSSGWRPFTLPFLIKKGPDRPEKLVINIVFPGRGKVWLGPLRLVEYEDEEEALMAPGQWWSGRQAGLIGGILGGAFGCIGGLIGFLSARGKARGLVLGALKAMFLIGLALLALAAIALVRSQPYEVFYPPLLLGALLIILPLGLIRTARKRYEQIELRKMQAMDAR